MMKFFKRSMVLLIGALLILSLCSCGEEPKSDASSNPKTESSQPPYAPQSARELWEKANSAPESLDSFQIKNHIDMVYYYAGNRFDATVDTSAVYTREGECSIGHNIICCEELDVDTTTYYTMAYVDGKMYMATKNEEYDQKLCAVATPAEYLESQSAALNKDVDFADCTTSEFNQAEDGSWNIRFSGYTKKTIEAMLDNLEMSDENLGATVQDMSVNATVNKDFCIEKIEINLIFEEVDETTAPKFYLLVEYFNFNTAEIDLEVLKPDEYTEVDNLSVLKKLSSAMEEKTELTEGKFLLDIKSTATINRNKGTSRERDKVEYGHKNGGFFYNIGANMDGHKIDIKYQGGTQTLYFEGKPNYSSQSEEDAKIYIENLINSAQYNQMAITDVEIRDDGSYVLTADDIDVKPYNGDSKETGVKYKSASQKIQIWFGDDGSLIKIEGTTKLKGTYNSQKLETLIETTVDFGVED